MMNWKQLLTRQRLGKSTPEKPETARTCFQQDFDRLVFSSPFRCLKDKTQVYPLSKNDYTRTRLTHSIEVSCVGRSLGTIVGEKMIEKHKDLKEENFNPSDFGSIVSAACLAHDIGNPPFGHAGEDAIRGGFQEWPNNLVKKQLAEQERTDFDKFEGNAQGFRVLTSLEMPDRDGGMQLTYPTLATFTKYPRESSIPEDILNNYSGRSIKKYGFFQSEKQAFSDVAQALGLINRNSEVAWWSRHPLAFLVEAADDICYRIVDLEDGYRMGLIPFDIAKSLFNKIADIKQEKIDTKVKTEEEVINYLRAVAINKLVQEVSQIFIDKEDSILRGEFDQELLSLSAYNSILKEIKTETIENVFHSSQVISLEIAGYEILKTLFIKFSNSALSSDSKRKKLLYMIPQRFRPSEQDSDYNKLQKITDYISGATDSYATNLFQTIRGISI